MFFMNAILNDDSDDFFAQYMDDYYDDSRISGLLDIIRDLYVFETLVTYEWYFSAEDGDMCERSVLL